MGILYLHLVRVAKGTRTSELAELIRQHSLSYRYHVVLFSEARFFVAAPTVVDSALLADSHRPWDCMVVLQPLASTNASGNTSSTTSGLLPNSLAHLVLDVYSLKCAVASSILDGFAELNARLHAESANPSTAGSIGGGFDADHLENLRSKTLEKSSDKLEASPQLLRHAQSLLATCGARPVTMLNLLRFNDGEPGLQSYRTYGKHFASSVGSRRGGNAKIVGKVLEPARVIRDGLLQPAGGSGGNGTGEKWDELAIVHYPNIVAFCDMAAGQDYQEVNQRYRLPALKDTLLLVTREMPLAAEPTAAATEMPSKL